MCEVLEEQLEQHKAGVSNLKHLCEQLHVHLDIDVNLTKLVSVLEEFKIKCPNNIFNFISFESL